MTEKTTTLWGFHLKPDCVDVLFKCNIILWVFWPVLMYRVLWILYSRPIETTHVGKCTVVIIIVILKEVLHPWPLLWLLIHFSQKLQRIGDKQDMFLIGDIPRNLITALEFHYFKWLLIYGSKRGKYWFLHIFYCNITAMVSTEVKLWFLSSLEHFWPDP